VLPLTPIGPGRPLFDAIQQALGALSIVADDLGVITPDVEVLCDGLGLPGMRILHFAFGDDADNAYLPHRDVPNIVAYTGTHDNNTARGWWQAASASVANLVMFPMQGVLNLDTKHRMNTPGTAVGNWTWRFVWPMVGAQPGPQLRRFSAAYGRCRLGRWSSG
jgi:4-alpha-glucanotransferase